MQFELPTSKYEMYNTLDQLFHYYRVRRVVYEDLVVEPLAIMRMSYVTPTDADLKDVATTLVAAEYESKERERREAIKEKITTISAEINASEKNKQDLIATVEKLYVESKEKVKIQAEKNGTANSGLILDRYSELENDKNDRIIKINQDMQQRFTALNAELDYLDAQLSGVSNYYEQERKYKIAAKVEELKEKRQEKIHEVFKYNNTIDEKEQRYANIVKESSANRELKYLEITSHEFSKDQLVSMGYYDDVIACVCGYYNTLDAVDAYRDINNDVRLPVYLDDYYENVLYMYKMKADA